MSLHALRLIRKPLIFSYFGIAYLSDIPGFSYDQKFLDMKKKCKNIKTMRNCLIKVASKYCSYIPLPLLKDLPSLFPLIDQFSL